MRSDCTETQVVLLKVGYKVKVHNIFVPWQVITLREGFWNKMLDTFVIGFP